MGKNWVETIYNLSYCNLYKMLGFQACIPCNNINCEHVRKRMNIKNNWILTDDDSFQYVKKNSESEFSLIEFSLINPETELYEVYKDIIDVENYLETMRGEVTTILEGFGYTGVEDVTNKYNDALQVIAECIFEYYGSFKAEQLFTGNKVDCEKFILKHISEY